MTSPLVSVVMSVHNGATDLAATLDSILSQTFTDFELIAIDDGSTDDTPAILAAAAQRDARIRIPTQPNAGLTRALMRGCAEARAPIVARHDAGDRSHPERFARQLACFDDANVVLRLMEAIDHKAPGVAAAWLPPEPAQQLQIDLAATGRRSRLGEADAR